MIFIFLPSFLHFPILIDIILRSSQEFSEETFARLAGMVTPQAHEHHVTSIIRNFTIILRIRWTSRFKIYKYSYRCPQGLWPVAGPLHIRTLNLCSYNNGWLGIMIFHRQIISTNLDTMIYYSRNFSKAEIFKE